MARYVKSPNPRVWWLNLAKRIDEHYDRNAVRMSEVLPQKRGTVSLIPETDSGQFLVYEVEASQLETLIDNCPGFEYNVLPHDFSWLFIETDHDMFYICRDHDVLPH
jgi:hypothetical protein